MIRLKTFGTAALQFDEPARRLGEHRRRLAVLAMLAAAGSEGISRDKLVAYVWPEAAEDHARHALAQTLYLLRRDVSGTDAVIGAQELRLDSAVVESDLAEFTRAVAAGDIDRVAQLYTGPFLDGFYLPGAAEFERWTERERSRLAAECRGAFERAARESVRHGDQPRALRCWRRVAALNPLDTQAALGVMESLAAIGDIPGALQHARLHETIVLRELETAPDPALGALAARLRARSLGAAVHPTHPKLIADPALTVLADSPESTGEHIATAAHRGVPRLGRIAGATLGFLVLAAIGARTFAVHHAIAGPLGQPTFAIGSLQDYAGSDSSGSAHALADMLATNLARVPALRVVSNARIYELVGIRKSLGRLNSAAQLNQAARDAGATEIIDGALYRQGAGTLRLDVRRVDANTGRIENAYSVEGADVFELVDRATMELSEDLGASRSAMLHVADVTTRSLVAYRLYEEGLRSYYQQNDPRGARRLFIAAASEDSTFAMAEFYAAQCELGLNMPALDHFVRAARLADHTTDRERLLVRGTVAFLTGEPATLIADTLISRYPAEPDGQYLLGRALTWDGDFFAALPHLRRAIDMDSLALTGSATRCLACDAYSTMVEAYWFADSLDAAERIARQWIRRQPDAPTPWRTLSGMLLFQGRYAEARAAERHAAQLAGTPSDPEVDAFIGLRSGDFGVADSILHRRVHDDPNGDGSWLLGISLRYQGRLRDALATTRPTQLRQSQASAAPRIGIAEAIILFELGRYNESADAFRQIAATPAYRPEFRARIARDRAWNLTHEATARAAAGDTAALSLLADSIESAARASAYGRDRRLHHYVRGLLLRARGDRESAVVEFRRGIFSLTEGYTRDNYELAQTLLSLHRPSEAIAVLQAALRGSMQASNSYITYSEIHELLAQAFDAAGRSDSAATHYAYVVRAWPAADPEFRARFLSARERLAALRPRAAAR